MTDASDFDSQLYFLTSSGKGDLSGAAVLSEPVHGTRPVMTGLIMLMLGATSGSRIKPVVGVSQLTDHINDA